MRKALLLGIIALLVGVHIDAQITLTQSSYSLPLSGTDSLRKTTYNSPLPSVAPENNATWDMTTTTDSVPIFYKYRVPAIAPYQFADSNDYHFAAFTYQANAQYSISSSGLSIYSIDLGSKAFPLTTTTDTIFVPSQTMNFSIPNSILKFPATSHSAWISNYFYSLSYEITYIPTFIHTPGIIKTYHTEKDTVTGWGRMRVKDASSHPSGYMDVLQVRTTIIATDTFYLNGSSADPMLPVLLSSLGLTQGKTDTTYQINYYRAGEVTPLARFDMNDAAFTQVKSVTYHQQRLPAEVAVSEVPKVCDLKVFPNPVCGSDLYLQLPAGAGDCVYELLSIVSTKIASGRVAINGTQGYIKLPEHIAVGNYIMQLKSNSGLSSYVVEISR